MMPRKKKLRRTAAVFYLFSMRHEATLQDPIFTKNFDRDISELRRKVREFGTIVNQTHASLKGSKPNDHQSVLRSHRKIRAKVEKLVLLYSLNKCFLS